MRSGSLTVAAGSLRGLVAALGILALGLGLVPAASAQGDGGQRAALPVFVYVTRTTPGARVTLRAGPSALFPAVGTVAYGERVQRLGCERPLGERWCRVRPDGGSPSSGWINARNLSDTPPPRPGGGGDDLAGGPDFWAVRGLGAGDLLNVRAEPSARARVLATLRQGEVVRNLGCRIVGQARWCRIRSTTGIDVTGWVAGRFLQESGPPAGGGPVGGGGGGGPDVWIVTGLALGDRLNVRSEPSTRGRVLATLDSGERVLNLGCRQVGQARWCRIRSFSGADVTGWVNGRYLREG